MSGRLGAQCGGFFSRDRQQAEAALVLEHQAHPAPALSLARDLLAYRAAQFF